MIVDYCNLYSVTDVVDNVCFSDLVTQNQCGIFFTEAYQYGALMTHLKLKNLNVKCRQYCQLEI